jgi:hypothetical protein
VERRADQLAWTILLGSFVVFCLIVGSVIGGVRWYFAHAMTPRPVRLDLIQGTALWLPEGSRQEVNAADRSMLAEGDRVRTTEGSEAILWFFDGSNLRLWPNTTVQILKTATSTYRPLDTDEVLSQDQGHVRYNIALPSTDSRQFEVQTPQASVILREGSYKVQVAPGQTVVTVTSGSATVSSQSQAVEVLQGEWVTAKANQPPSTPESDVHNILTNGDFSQELAGWQPGNRAVEDGIPGQIQVREESNRPFAELWREGSDKHAETFIHKTINEDVTDYGMLRFAFQLRILEQTLSGGGDLGSEFPLSVRVHYRDSSGSEADWVHSYYIQNRDHLPTPNADQVIQNQWTDESIDLFDPTVVSPRPAEILWIEFSASGHGYRSDIGRVQLLVD